MKVCTACKLPKPLDEFRNHQKSKDGKGVNCIPCAREKGRQRYRSDEQYRQQIHQHTADQVALLQEYTFKYLSTHPCVDCNEPDLVVLDFDHVRGEKRHNVSRLANMAVSLKTLILEIEKCEVRCANCHRRRTAERHGGWRRSFWGVSVMATEPGC